MGQDAAPAGRGTTHPFALGWSGVTVRPHYGGLPLTRLDVALAKGRKLPDPGWVNGLCPEERSFGQKERRGGAP